MISCKNCKHWGMINTHDDKGLRACNRIKDWIDTPVKETKPLAVTVDHDDYKSWLETAPEFGCVLGEANHSVVKFSGITSTDPSFPRSIYVYVGDSYVGLICNEYRFGAPIGTEWRLSESLKERWPALREEGTIRIGYPSHSEAVTAVRDAAEAAEAGKRREKS